jgi:hypothetical protein
MVGMWRMLAVVSLVGCDALFGIHQLTGDAGGNVPLDTAVPLVDAVDAASASSPVLHDKATGYAASGMNVSATLSGSASAGDLELVLITWVSPAALLTIYDTGGEHFAQLASSTDCAVYWARVTNPVTPNNLTAAFDGPTGTILSVAEYTRVAAATPFDGSASLATGSNAMATSGNVTTTLPDDTLVAQVAASIQPQGGSGYVVEGSSQYTVLEDRLAAVPGTYDATSSFVSPPGFVWCIGLVALEGQ